MIANLSIEPLPSRPRGGLPRDLYRWILRLSGRQQLLLLLWTFLLFPLSLAPLELQRRMVDRAIGAGDARMLLWLALLYLLAVLLYAGLKYLRNLHQGLVAEGAIRLLRKRVAAAGDSEAEGGQRAAMLASEAERIGGFIGESVAFPLFQAGLFASTLGYLLWMQPLLALAVFLLFLPAVLLAVLLQRRIDRHARARVRLVRAAGDLVARTTRTAADAAGRRIDAVYRRRQRIYLLKYGLKFANNLTGQLGPLLILAVGGLFVLRGEATTGTLVAFLSAFERLVDPLRELAGFYRRLSVMRTQYRLFADALEEPSRQAPPSAGR